MSAAMVHPAEVLEGPPAMFVPDGADAGTTAEAIATVTVPAPRRILVDSFAPPADATPTWGGRIPTVVVDPAARRLPRFSQAGFASLVGAR